MKSLNRETTQLPANKPNKVLQFGGGNFLRAFVDFMIDELNTETDFNAGVIVVKPTKKGDYKDLKAQDGLFHVRTIGIRNGKVVSELQLIECVQKIINPYLEWNEFLKTAECDTIRFIISNTTELGIKFSEIDTFYNHPPVEFPAKLMQWLFHRWEYFKGTPESGCIILPCELIAQNGQTLKNCVLRYVESWGLDTLFIDWIKEHNYFCNTLVDRIVPGFPVKNSVEIYKEIGFEDALIVDAEPYHLWAIEAPKEIEAEIPFNKTYLNVVFTHDLEPFSQLKVLILNGAHTISASKGYLEGFDTVREAIENEGFIKYLKATLSEEILPILAYPQTQKEAYLNDVLDRFGNPFIEHQLLSISLNATSKFKTRLLPSLLGYINKTGNIPKNLVVAFATLICFYSGKRGSEKIPLNDNETTLLFFKTIWQHWETTKNTNQLVVSVLENTALWNQDLNLIDGLAEALENAVDNQLTKIY